LQPASIFPCKGVALELFIQNLFLKRCKTIKLAKTPYLSALTQKMPPPDNPADSTKIYKIVAYMLLRCVAYVVWVLLVARF